MSKFEYTFTTDLPIDVCQKILEQLMNSTDWKTTVTDNYHIKINEPVNMAGMMSSGGYPAKIEVGIMAQKGGTLFTVSASNFGMGPLQSRHVKQKAAEVISSIQEIIQVVQTKRNETVNRINSGVLCPTCGKTIPPGTRFCPYDGTPISLECKKCGAKNIPAAQFCSNCGAQI